MEEKKTLQEMVKDGWRRTKEFGEDVYRAGKEFYKEHEKEVKAVAPYVVPVVFMAVKHMSKNTKVDKERTERENRFYDPRTGRYCYARRALTPAEQMSVERRYRLGESYTEILYSMKLLA